MWQWSALSFRRPPGIGAIPVHLVFVEPVQRNREDGAASRRPADRLVRDRDWLLAPPESRQPRPDGVQPGDLFQSRPEKTGACRIQRVFASIWKQAQQFAPCSCRVETPPAQDFLQL